MFLDTSRAPVIFAHTHGHSPFSFEHQLTALLTRLEAFVLITNHGRDDHFDETSLEKKQRTLFLKNIRASLVALCRGVVVLEKGSQPRPPWRWRALLRARRSAFLSSLPPMRAWQ